MALKFSGSPSEYTFTVDKFGGVDFSTQPNKVSMSRSPNAKNMIMNENGYLEKRTGYKQMYVDGSARRINGIFTYHYTTSGGVSYTKHFAHIGTALYEISFSGDTMVLGSEIMSGLTDTKSRAFELRDGLYILGCGKYIKLFYDKVLGCFSYGAVCKSEKSNTESIIANRQPSVPSSTFLDYCFESNLKTIRYTGTFKFGAGSTTKTILYLGTVEQCANMQVMQVKLNGTDILNSGLCWLRAQNDTNAYIILMRETSAITEKYTGTMDVCVAFDNALNIPTTFELRTPSVNSGTVDDAQCENPIYDGNAVDAVNLCGGRRRVTFPVQTAGTNIFCLEGTTIGRINRILINGISIDRITQGNYLLNHYNTQHIQYNGSKWVYLSNALITNGDFVEIEYIPDNDTSDTAIDKCSIYGIYGGANDTRVVLSGNSEYPNRDYMSGDFEASYFPDNMFSEIGTSDSPIIGYAKLYSNQIIIKKGNGSDVTQYRRSCYEDADGMIYYSVTQGSNTPGACSVSSVKSVEGNPYYLSDEGVFSILGTQIENEHTTQRKSSYIDGRLTKEANLENAVCIADGDRYCVAVGNHMYLYATSLGEWFYYDNLPDISCMWIYNDTLYFGTVAGKICRFMKTTEQNAYYDDIALDGSTENALAIDSVWEFPQTALDEYTMYKTIRNVYLTCMPYHRSSVKVFYNTNDDYEDETMEENIDLFDFTDMDFERFTFNTIPAPQVFATGVKCKNVFVFGLKLQNNVEGEPFGVLAVSIRYRKSKYIK